MSRRSSARNRRSPYRSLSSGAVEPGPLADMSFYGDVASSIASSNTIASAWSSATTPAGSPLLIVDSVAGGSAIRTGTSDTLATSAGAAGFLSSGDSTVILVWRSLKYNNGSPFPVLDTTNLGTVRGYQIQANGFLGATLFPRIYNGSSWTLDPGTGQGMFIPLKWHIAIIRVSATKFDVEVDGQFLNIGGSAISLTFPGAALGPLKIGGGPQDFQLVQLYSSRLSDAAVAAKRDYFANRFRVDMAPVIGGDPTLTSNVSALFPYMSKLPGGKLYVTMFRGSDESPHDTNYNEERLSGDGGNSWSSPTTILSSNAVTRYSDVHTSEPLSDGNVVQSWFTYDSADNIQPGVQWRKSTGFNADGSPIWGSINTVTLGTPQWAASGAQIVENPDVPGEWHWPIFRLNAGATHESIYDYKSSNSGGSWSAILIADGEVDSKRYAEPAFLFTGTTSEIYCMTRVVNAATAFHTRSTNSGTTWAAPTDSGAAYTSSAQGLRKLSSGRYVQGPSRVAGSYTESGMFWRAAGAAWNASWVSPPVSMWVDPFFGGNYYGGCYETSPGVLALVGGRASGNQFRNNVFTRANFYTWYFDHAMPGSGTPSTASIAAGQTQLVTVKGAGDYVITFTANVSGADAVLVGTNILYTAGPANGVDVFTVTDVNGIVIATCTFTVTGGAATWTPGLMTQAKAWLRPTAVGGITLDVNSRVATLPDLSGNGRTASAANTSNAPATTTLSGKTVVDFGNGVGAHELLYPAHTFDALTEAEVFLVGKFSSATPGASGFWSMGTDGSGDFHPFAANAFYDCFGSTVRNGPSAAPADLSTPFVYNAISTAANWVSYVNRVLVYTAGSNTVAWPAAPKFGRNVNGTATTMLFLEKFVCAPLSPVLRAKVLDYFTAQWGTP